MRMKMNTIQRMISYWRMWMMRPMRMMLMLRMRKKRMKMMNYVQVIRHEKLPEVGSGCQADPKYDLHRIC